MKRILAFLITYMSISNAAYVNLDPKSTVEFAKLRVSMMKKELAAAADQIGTIERAIATMKNRGESGQLKNLVMKMNKLRVNTQNLQQQITVTENSINALTKK